MRHPFLSERENGKRRKKEGKGVIIVGEGGRRVVWTWGFVLFSSSVSPSLSWGESGLKSIKIHRLELLYGQMGTHPVFTEPGGTTKPRTEKPPTHRLKEEELISVPCRTT